MIKKKKERDLGTNASRGDGKSCKSERKGGVRQRLKGKKLGGADFQGKNYQSVLRFLGWAENEVEREEGKKFLGWTIGR